MVSSLAKLACVFAFMPTLRATMGTLAVKRCTPLNENDRIDSASMNCFCHVPKEEMQLKNIWSTFKVKINSSETFAVMHILTDVNCQIPENISVFIKCGLQNIWHWGESKERTISLNRYGDEACIQVQPIDPSSSYTIHAMKEEFDIRLFLMFCSGLLLFWYADSLSRCTLFYYSAGVSLGILATLVLLLMVLKQFITRHSTFGLLLTVGCTSSLYIINYFKENMAWLWYENKVYLLAYFLTTGLVSFAVCYKHGPLTNQRSITLLNWMLEFTGYLLIYFGVAISPIAYGVMVVLFCSKGLCYPVKLLYYMSRKIKGCLPFCKPVVRLLTEEEFREQGETETAKALEELRSFCKTPEFSSWIAVSRIHYPKKFAEFVLGAYHLSPEEVQTHDEQYGPGGLFLEEQIFNPIGAAVQDQSMNANPEETNVEDDEENNSFLQ